MFFEPYRPGSGWYHCPHMLRGNDGNGCKWLPLDGADSFRAGLTYYLTVIMRNENGRIISHSPITIIHTHNIGKTYHIPCFLVYMNPF